MTVPGTNTSRGHRGTDAEPDHRQATSAASGQARRVVLSRAAGFWLVAAALFLMLFASAAASPLYGVYPAQWHFSATTLTAVFAVYVLALLLTLLAFGSLSDYLGRRRVIAVALAAGAGACGLFLAAHGVGLLFAARALQGVAAGRLPGPARRRRADPRRDRNGIGGRVPGRHRGGGRGRRYRVLRGRLPRPGGAGRPRPARRAGGRHLGRLLSGVQRPRRGRRGGRNPLRPAPDGRGLLLVARRARRGGRWQPDHPRALPPRLAKRSTRGRAGIEAGLREGTRLPCFCTRGVASFRE
jgi:hypothetical protein